MNPEAIFEISPVTLARIAPSLPQAVLRVAVLFDGHRRLWEVLRDSPLSGRMTVPVVERLLALGVIVPEGSGAPTAPPPDAAEPAAAPTRPAEPGPGRDPVAEAPTLRMRPPRPASAASAPAEAAPAAAADAPKTAATATAGENETQPRARLSASTDTRPRRPPRREEPWAETLLMPSPAPSTSQAEAPAPAFDETDEAFFDSYAPEDTGVDTFWDLEDTPLARRRALERQRRLEQARSRRPGPSGWLRSLFAMF